MLIGIDGNEANIQKRVGISEYVYWLLYYFAQFNRGAKDSRLDFSIYLKRAPLESMPAPDASWQYKVFGPKKFWTQFALPFKLYMGKPRPDVFFSPSHYAPRFSPVPSVVSVMDLSYLYFPDMFNKSDLFQLRSWTAYSVKKAKKVLTISKSTKNDIIQEYKIPAERVVVTYPGIKEKISFTPHVYGMNELKAKYHLSDNFILFVGTLQPRKNIGRLIEAFSKTLKSAELRRENLQLVIIGKKGWLYEEILAAPGKFGVKDSVKFLHGVNDEELTLFYKYALCYVLPSLYEGFGLPVLEAMQRGCPVITSNRSSLPEAGGDATLYVDPEDVDDIAEKMVQLVTDEKLRKTLVEKGKKQVKKFSWEKTARETLKVLEEAAR